MWAATSLTRAVRPDSLKPAEPVDVGTATSCATGHATIPFVRDTWSDRLPKVAIPDDGGEHPGEAPGVSAIEKAMADNLSSGNVVPEGAAKVEGGTES